MGADQADREDWEPIVAAYVSTRHSDPADMRNTLKFLAMFLRKDNLPKSGREFLADWLEAIAAGGDPRSILPRTPRKPRAISSIKIMVAVEKEIERCGVERADEKIHERVGNRLKNKIGPGTVATRAAEGRARVRRAVAEEVSKGTKPEKVLDIMAKAIGLSKARIERFL